MLVLDAQWRELKCPFLTLDSRQDELEWAIVTIEKRIQVELEVSPHSSWHHGLQVPLLHIPKAVAVSFVHSPQDLEHAVFVLCAQKGEVSD